MEFTDTQRLNWLLGFLQNPFSRFRSIPIRRESIDRELVMVYRTPPTAWVPSEAYPGYVTRINSDGIRELEPVRYLPHDGDST